MQTGSDVKVSACALHCPHLNVYVYTDATVVARRQEAMEAARRKMQEEHDAKAAMFKEKQKSVQ